MKTIAIAAIAGLAAAASAQETFSYSLVGAPATVDTSSGDVTFTMNVVANSSFGSHILGGSYGVESNSALVSDMQWSNPSWSAFPTDDIGYLGNGNYGQVIYGQLLIFGLPPFDVPGAGSELPDGDAGSFEVTVAAGTSGVINFELTGQQPFSLETIDMVDGTGTVRSSDGILTLNGLSVNVVPAPSALALLGLGGLVAGRRRR